MRILLNIMVVLIVILAVIGIHDISPDKRRQGMPVMVGTSLGFILNEDRINTILFNRDVRRVQVIYLDHVGEWHEVSLPANLVLSLPLKKDEVSPNHNKNSEKLSPH